jgi:3-oxoisoapionate decarboxylase
MDEHGMADVRLSSQDFSELERRVPALTFSQKGQNISSMLRREWFAAAMTMLTLPSGLSAALAGRRLGVVIHSFSHRWQSKRPSIKHPAFHDVLDVMDRLQGLGVGSLQVGVAGWSLELAQQARVSSESYDMGLEGMVRLPQGKQDVERFTRELRAGKEAGMSLFRVAAGSRRYETFTRRADFEIWLDYTRSALVLAESVARRLGVRLAIENHKDFETAELLAILQAVPSPHLGICLDTGNNLALLEDPREVVQRLAPYTLTVHLKDIAMRAVEDGFEMAEVPLGQGMLDLPTLIATITQAAPQAGFHLEMITRDPLLIPCLREDYWATFPEKSGLHLAQALKRVKEHAAKELPKVSTLSSEALLALEERNVLLCMAHAASELGFSQMNMKALRGEER